MQELRTFTKKIEVNHQPVVFDINEKDMDDSICYDIFSDGIFLFSISKEGEVIYNSTANSLDPASMDKLIQEAKKSI